MLLRVLTRSERATLHPNELAHLSGSILALVGQLTTATISFCRLDKVCWIVRVQFAVHIEERRLGVVTLGISSSFANDQFIGGNHPEGLQNEVCCNIHHRIIKGCGEYFEKGPECTSAIRITYLSGEKMRKECTRNERLYMCK